MNPIHAGPRLTLLRLFLTIGSMALFLWLAAVRISGWGALAVFLVAEIVVYQSFTRLVTQRRRDLALLRCFGASRGQIFGGVLAEAASVGLLGAIAGMAGGVLLEQHHGAFYIFAVLAGVGGAVIAAAVPAFQASRVPPAGPET
ncbi:ABC transporter permease [Actinocrispum wychmicini]|uniref:FtsX-like permease family protein n=1 Tax=Actinocrispum wychmicini TaxID=1213861 RepID=A0A4V2S6L5_9PSEU|nr:FtsX-like permease family protein [Actinocrispum wychmicini]TCO56560.1 FtsX-like permease family protein [Actinocrispum wychmicini]